MSFGNGPWKEGRVGGASLCYIRLRADQLDAVATHHAAVGIRATVAGHPASATLQTLAERNWDLAELITPDTTNSGLLLHRTDPPGYQLTTVTGLVPPKQSPPAALPSMPSPDSLPAWQAEIEAAMSQHHWGIWRIDAAGLDALTLRTHANLLRWLGDHHARIWCAPIFDIHRWLTQA